MESPRTLASLFHSPPSKRTLDPGMDSRVHTSVVWRSACGSEDAPFRKAGRVDGRQHGLAATLRTHGNFAFSCARFERLPALRAADGDTGACGSALGLTGFFACGAVAHFCSTRSRRNSLPQSPSPCRRKTPLPGPVSRRAEIVAAATPADS